jgi:outer membrane murein-binding lipoprotein Lpp
LSSDGAHKIVTIRNASIEFRKLIVIAIVSGTILCSGFASNYAMKAQQQQQACASQESKTDFMKLSSQIGIMASNQALRNHSEDMRIRQRAVEKQSPLPDGITALGDLDKSESEKYEKEQEDLGSRLFVNYLDQHNVYIKTLNTEIDRMKACQAATTGDVELAQKMQIWMAMLASLIWAVGGFVFSMTSSSTRKDSKEET